MTTRRMSPEEGSVRVQLNRLGIYAEGGYSDLIQVLYLAKGGRREEVLSEARKAARRVRVAVAEFTKPLGPGICPGCGERADTFLGTEEAPSVGRMVGCWACWEKWGGEVWGIGPRSKREAERTHDRKFCVLCLSGEHK